MKKISSLLVLALLIFAGCSSDDSEDEVIEAAGEFDGSINSVENLFSSETLETFEALGFVINPGDNPPPLEGEYFVTPYRLVDSNIPGDNIGSTFADYRLFLSNQNNGDLTIDLQGINGNQTDNGSGSFISGEGNRFSAYLLLDAQIDGSPVTKVAYAISGVMTDDGINDFQLALVMLDDAGDPNGVYIENDTGRLFEDGDGSSPKQ